MNDPNIDREPRHPIGVVARRTGIAPDLLRAWERRYDAVSPGRAPAGRRLYSDLDIERLRLLQRVVQAGRRISDVASLPLADLEQLVREDEQQSVEPMPRAARRDAPPDAAAYHGECMAAVESLDRTRLELALGNATIDLSGPVLRRDLLGPLMEEIGDRWRQGSLRIVHEHLASSTVRSFLGAHFRASQGGGAGPQLIVTTPRGQLHEIGAMIAASSASEAGWSVTYLGPNLPAEEIAACVKQKRAQAVALSIVYPADDPVLHEELRKLREFVGPEVALLVGGAAAPAYRVTLEAVDALPIVELDDLQQALEARLA